MMSHIKQNKVRKILTKKVRQMYDIVADVENLLTEMETDFYRVCIFGSARISENSPVYQLVEDLAEALAKQGVDIVTGGGPGLMEAANKGAKKGSHDGARSIGLPIELPFESDANSHLDVKSHHRRFSSRLDEFMRLTRAVIVVPGGIGTLLELFYTWQLLQVSHIKQRPLILFATDHYWKDFIDWIQKYPINKHLMSAPDLNMVQLVSSVDETVTALLPDINQFKSLSRTHQGSETLED